jgi:hypothetical protein
VNSLSKCDAENARKDLEKFKDMHGLPVEE